MGKGYQQGDAQLKVTRALPSGAATVNSSGIDLGISSAGDFLAPCELLISAPALATGVLGDAATVKYSIEHDDASGFGTAALLVGDVLVQTGAGGAGAAAATVRVALPTHVKKHIRLKVVKSASGDASGSTATLELKF